MTEALFVIFIILYVWGLWECLDKDFNDPEEDRWRDS